MSSLSDLLRRTATMLDEQGHAEIDDTALQLALYHLREAPEAPARIKALRFDWDGPSPRCAKVDELLNGLRWVEGFYGRRFPPMQREVPYAREIADEYLRIVTPDASP